MRTDNRPATGTRLEALALRSIRGDAVHVGAGGGLVHLQFRRFAGCPICSVHLQSFVRRYGEVIRAGVREIVVFHSSQAELLRYAGDLPFDVVADPHKQLYRRFGVEAAPRALLNPRAWPGVLWSVLRVAAEVVFSGKPMPPLRPAGGSWGLPADFLIGDGQILACRYGKHADDQWSVDEMLNLARPHTRTQISGPELEQRVDAIPRKGGSILPRE